MLDAPKLNPSIIRLMLTTSNTAGHESSLGDDNRGNVEGDRRHEAPYAEGMTSTPDNGFYLKACCILEHFKTAAFS